ncbi:glutathione-regulated potassium-efflux system ancillary protein KefG [Vibrio cincinnatiensis]|jgi:glutathione-regulated potassium-efflux system ancillary protein KefG|uniref:Glutathione-regulated potassium-efflux system ancillary protein KefG n=1 Tax=Vibrio cincinnatiensis DSM 19608 TaxID=1123491 RepID=A0A1T4QXF3_VIBCI|nr:glutathione-regulated potassium-efflux system ancillary protein KefG [Vibrio cincinnatiensis]MCG3722175.1 glutathione-regulated potassium-efflux system ancillary protein KefG [Vibrio cincinnatiensis]MCG3725196.1 glutathione-regulated potassium-efflux system ancillary protein KefG [Vibrio cincinnatiensis]MCG3739661.1 glutathione-regulated potassium-efflux system ancillary protein KefG [Vibrio cincinnatiensis]MCG3766543.1 glutathione-regulated potassium-efflux system ancillary protein KefG [Vi
MTKDPSCTHQPNVLVIYAHPDPDHSVANKGMIERISTLSHVTVFDLYATYPDFFIDVHQEHQRLLEHDVIVFQHPLYLYSCPALLKEWMDTVLGKGFAFGPESALQGKYWRSVITAGGQQDAFTEQGYNRYSLNELLQPFELTAALCRMHWLDPLVLYWARNISAEERQQHAERYFLWLKGLVTNG